MRVDIDDNYCIIKVSNNNPKEIKMNDILTKEIELCGNNMSQQDSDSMAELIYDCLMERGIFVESFSWSINVEYTPQDDLDG